MRVPSKATIAVVTLLSISVSTFAYTQEEVGTATYSGEVVFGRLANAEKQAEFVNKLTFEGITYRINSRGLVVHQIKNTAQVLGISRAIIYGVKLHPEVEEVAFYSGTKEREFISNQLEQQGIPFQIREDNKHQNMGVFRYSQEFGPKVDLIVQKLRVWRENDK